MPGENKKIASVTFGPGDMDAFLFLAEPSKAKQYTVDEIMEILAMNGVRAGVIYDQVEKVVKQGLYKKDVLVAKGVPAVDGTDGRYEFKFNTKPLNKPKVREDGSVDYWDLQTVESVFKGQVIATYIPAVQGKMGFTVKGKVLNGKRGKELLPLRGTGFKRADDNVTYIAEMDGKIEYRNDKIMVSNVYEVFGNADLSVGNIDFQGDVIIHGMVASGVCIKAKGSITVDGNIEAAQLIAGKDILLRSGMQGGFKASVKSEGNIVAKFFENTAIEAKGDIEANVIMNSNVSYCENLRIHGKKGAIIGGRARALQSISATNIGNDAGVVTELVVGVEAETHLEILRLKKQLDEIRKTIDKVEEGIATIDALQDKVTEEHKKAKMQLLRVKVKSMADIATETEKLEKLEDIIMRSRDASIRAEGRIYPRTSVRIHGKSHIVADEQRAVQYRMREEKIIMYGVNE